MGKMLEGVKTIDSATRTILLACLLAVVATVAFYAYSEYTAKERLLADQEAQLEDAKSQLVSLNEDLSKKQVEIASLKTEVKEKSEQIERLQTAMHLLKTDQRLAQLRVLGIDRDEDGRAIQCQLEFVELSPDGEPLSEPKQFELPGDLVYIDNWLVKFDDQFIEQADLQRGTSLCLFRRIFSEQQLPTEGFSLDQVGMRPQAYASGGKLTDFEKQLWDDFWEFANDPEKASENGIRAANGEAVSIKVRESRAYSITLRSSGGLSIKPVIDSPDS